MPDIRSRIPATVFRDGTPQKLTQAEEELKRNIYEKMTPRRRKFIDRIGYDNWDPFQKPNDPMDIRMDASQRTTQQLCQEFLRFASANKGEISPEYKRGALECALGVINKDEKYLGIFEFCQWYCDLLKKEGVLK